MRRCGPPEVFEVSFVSWWMRSEIVPVSPRWLNATDVNATSGITHVNATAAVPTRLRMRSDGACLPTRKPMISPAASSATTIVTSRKPELARSALAHADRHEVLGERVAVERPEDHRRRADHRHRQHDHAAHAQRHEQRTRSPGR